MHTREQVLEENIRKALDRLNWLYGRGDVESFELDEHTGRGTVKIGIPTAAVGKYYYSRRFHLNNSTVYYAGHQQKIEIPA